MIKDEIIDALNTLESFGVSEETMRDILLNGIDFNFSCGGSEHYRDRSYDIFEFANILKTFREMNIDVDANAIIQNPTEYEEFITVSEGVASLKRKFNKNAH